MPQIDYFSYATVSGYLNSRGVAAEGLRAFLQHTLVHRPDLVAALRPTDDPSFNVGGQDEALHAAFNLYDTQGNGRIADVLSVV